jgi:TRAP-type uncharacterized transport system fused permease subunit
MVIFVHVYNVILRCTYYLKWSMEDIAYRRSLQNSGADLWEGLFVTVIDCSWRFVVFPVYYNFVMKMIMSSWRTVIYNLRFSLSEKCNS